MIVKRIASVSAALFLFCTGSSIGCVESISEPRLKEHLAV